MTTNSLRFAVVLLSSLFLSGCIVGPHGHGYGSRSSAVTAAPNDCPPGHRWSDGRCHSKGKGHDPAKHRKNKGHGHD